MCKLAEIQDEGALYRFEVGDKPILVTRLGEEYFATDSTCTHEEADLSLGVLMGETLMCPLHQARFDIRTGEVQSGPDGGAPSSIPALRRYDSKIEDGELWIEV